MKIHFLTHYMRVVIVFMLTLGASAVAADDFNHGVRSTATGAVLWFEPLANTSWVDAHYSAGAGNQNIRMSFNNTTGHFEHSFAAQPNTVVNYSFTYTKDHLAYDSASFSGVVGDDSQSPGKVAKPSISPAGGTYSSAQQVVMTSVTAGAALHYTLDGTTPTSASALYSGPIVIATSSTLKAIALKNGMVDSAASSATYTILDQTNQEHGINEAGDVSTLWFAPAGGSAWVDAHYRINNGAQQNIRMQQVNGRHEQPFTAPMASDLVVDYFFTYMTSTGARDSEWFQYSRNDEEVITPPVFSPAAGTYGAAQTVSLTSVAGAAIYYTLDGTAPSESALLYSGPISVTASVILNAIAIHNNNASEAITAQYIIEATDQQVASPVLSPAGGTYATAQTVSINSSTPAAAIHYTTDGSPATAASPMYSGSFVLSGDAVVRAIALKNDMINSNEVSEAYQINEEPPHGDYVKGVSQLGASTTLWIKNNFGGTFVDVHYTISQNGHTSAQENHGMVFNAELNRWERVVNTPTTGTLNYFYTYPTAQGNKDSEWFHHELGGACDVASPQFSPNGGVFNAPVAVTLNAPEGVIHYTVDGSAATANSPVYMGNPISVDTAVTLNAITVLSGGQESCLASESYVIDDGVVDLTAPQFSMPSGSYDTIIRVTMLTETTGAFIRYTLDGSEPNETSPVFTAPIELGIDERFTPAIDTHRIRARAYHNGVASSITEAVYTITQNVKSEWNGYTTFTISNGTQGKHHDSEVYWAIIGKDWDTGQFVHVDLDGNLIPMSLGDNVVPKNGRMYTNYFHTLAEQNSVTIPAINSARVLMSVGSPMFIEVNIDADGNVAYAGANIENPTDPNLDVIFDFGEFAIVPKGSAYQGIFINTTRVDHFGFPLKLHVTGLDGYEQTVGEPLTETRDELFAKFIAQVPAEFRGLAKAPYAPYRVMAPAHASFQVSPEGIAGENAEYLDAYIAEVWNKWRNEELVLTLDNGWDTFRGRVEGDSLVFDDGLGEYFVHGIPTTSMAMLGNGLLDDASGTAPGSDAYHKQLQLQAQVTAALNRHVAHLQGEFWHSAELFYPEGEVANWYTKFWHDHAINGLTYGFSYDDIGGFSPSIYTYSPVEVNYIIGQ